MSLWTQNITECPVSGRSGNILDIPVCECVHMYRRKRENECVAAQGLTVRSTWRAQGHTLPLISVCSLLFRAQRPKCICLLWKGDPKASIQSFSSPLMPRVKKIGSCCWVIAEDHVSGRWRWSFLRAAPLSAQFPWLPCGWGNGNSWCTASSGSIQLIFLLDPWAGPSKQCWWSVALAGRGF